MAREGIDPVGRHRAVASGLRAILGWVRNPPGSEQITPELVLVAPPDIAARARALLSEADIFATAERARPSGTTSEIDRRSAGIACVIDLDVVERLPRRRHAFLRIFAASVVALGLAAVAAVVHDHRSASTREAVQPVPAAPQVPHRTVLQRPAQAKPAARRSHVSRARRASDVRPLHATRPRTRVAHATRRRPRAIATPRAVKRTARVHSPRSGTFVPARSFTWPAQPGASAYVVRFFRNGRLIASLHSTNPRVALPASFRFKDGRYRWQVFPVVAGRRVSAVVDSTFALPGG